MRGSDLKLILHELAGCLLRINPESCVHRRTRRTCKKSFTSGALRHKSGGSS